MQGTLSFAKVYVIKILQATLTTESTQKILLCQDEVIIDMVTQLLVDSCTTKDLVVISAALFAFYDIFSENFYDRALISRNVISMMEGGMPELE